MHFPFLFDLFFISRQYVNIPRGEQADLAVCSTPAGCNGSSGTPAAIQLNNQIVKELWVRLIRLSKISVHSVKDFGFRIIYGGKKISGDCGRDYLIQLQQQKNYILLWCDDKHHNRVDPDIFHSSVSSLSGTGILVLERTPWRTRDTSGEVLLTCRIWLNTASLKFTQATTGHSGSTSSRCHIHAT